MSKNFKFQPQLYFSNDEKPRLFLQIIGDGPSIDIDHTMPPELRAEKFDQDKFERFWHLTLPLWLVDDQFSNRAKGRTSCDPINVKWSEHIDLEQLGFVKNGEIDPQRVWSLLPIIRAVY